MFVILLTKVLGECSDSSLMGCLVASFFVDVSLTDSVFFAGSQTDRQIYILGNECYILCISMRGPGRTLIYCHFLYNLKHDMIARLR